MRGQKKCLCLPYLPGLLGLCLSAVLLCGRPEVSAAQAEDDDPCVYDDAGLLTDDERDVLEQKAAGVEEQTGWNIYAVTTDDAEGKSAMAYADDFFDTHSPEQEDGVVLLIDMDNREIWISTCGEAIRYLTDARIDRLLDGAYEDVSNGYYADGMEAMLDGVGVYYDSGIPSGQYNYDEDTGAVSAYRSITPLEFLVVTALAIGSGAVMYLVVAGKYRLRFNTYQYAYRENSDVHLRVREDRFVNQMTTHRRIQTQSSSGGSSGSHSSGRSSTHHSSSGRSHGGGGRKF